MILQRESQPGWNFRKGQVGQECPLVIVRSQFVVYEDTVAQLPGTVLQRQRDQIAEPTGSHSVLAGKEPLDEEQAIAIRELDPTAHLALQHNQLLPQRGILCFKAALGLEERGTQIQEEEYQRAHRGRR